MGSCHARPGSGVLRGPANSTASLICQKHTGKFPTVTGKLLLPEEKAERRRKGLSGARGVIAGQPRLACFVPLILSNNLSHPEPFALLGRGHDSRPHWVLHLFQVLP